MKEKDCCKNHVKDDKKNRLVENKVLLASTVLTISAVLLIIMGVGIHYLYLNKSLPRQTFVGLNIGGMTMEDAYKSVSNRWDYIQNNKFDINVDDETKALSLKDLGYSFSSSDRSISSIQFYEKGTPYTQLLLSFVRKKNIAGYIRSDQIKTETVLYNEFDNLERMSNASFRLAEDRNLVVKAEQTGSELDWEEFNHQVLALFSGNNNIKISPKTIEPAIKEAELKAVESSFLDTISKPLQITFENKNWNINWLEQVHMIAFEPKSQEANNQIAFNMTVNNPMWDYYVESVLIPEIERPAEDIEIKLSADGKKAEFTGQGGNGIKIDRLALAFVVDELLNNPDTPDRSIAIPVNDITGNIIIAKELKEMGVTGLLAAGHTSYYGSPSNRQHNIAVGMEKFNGMIIKSGERFSFNDNLGPVEAHTGFLPELVIKPEGTIPEYGGGLCQVSTTLYRAVLNADLPIEERRNHSYAVSYYAQQMGHGLDATIYPGASDLVFTNTSDSALVLQSYSIGQNAYFNVYGAPSNKVVSYEGPYISNHRGAPPAIEIIDPKLAPGERRQVEKPHNGFDVLWYKIVKYPDGREEKQEIVSIYRAVPAKFLIGPPANNNDTGIESGATLEPVNEFSS